MGLEKSLRNESIQIGYMKLIHSIENDVHCLLKKFTNLSEEVLTKKLTDKSIFANIFLKLTEPKYKTLVRIKVKRATNPEEMLQFLLSELLNNKLSDTNLKSTKGLIDNELKEYQAQKSDSVLITLINRCFYLTLLIEVMERLNIKETSQILKLINNIINKINFNQIRTEDILLKETYIKSILNKNNFKSHEEILSLDQKKLSDVQLALVAYLSYRLINENLSKKDNLLAAHYNAVINLSNKINARINLNISADQFLAEFIVCTLLLFCDYNKGLFLPLKERINYLQSSMSKQWLIDKLDSILNKSLEEKLNLAQWTHVLPDIPLNIGVVVLFLIEMVIAYFIINGLEFYKLELFFINSIAVLFLMYFWFKNRINKAKEDIKESL